MSFGGGTIRGFCFAQKLNFLIGLSLSSLNCFAGEAAPEVENIQTLRVLIGRYDDSKTHSFNFKGQALQSSDRSVRGIRSVDCRRENTLAASLLNMDLLATRARSIRWICKAGQNQIPVLGSLSFSDRSGFFQIEERWYRGHLELRDTGKSLLVINHISIDDYIASLLHGEMPQHFEAEALKAQAVAARSYAVSMALERRRASSPFDLLDNTKDQVYPGAHKESSKGNLAAEETKNQFLVYKGRILKSFYHAASGGYSEVPSAVWLQREEPDNDAYLARPNIYDKGHYSWQLSLSPLMFESAFAIGKLLDLRVNHKTDGFRVHSLELVGTERSSLIQLGSLRKLLSSIRLKSLKFDVKKEGTLWKFEGEGWGHGVGLSQIAAQNMAKLGKSYKEILRFHYPSATLYELAKDKAKPLDDRKSDDTLLVQVR